MTRARETAGPAPWPPRLTEEEKRQRALALFAETEARYGVTRGNGKDGAGVTSGPGPVPPAAGGPILGKKIAENPAAARAPQAGRWPTGPQTNRGATGSSAPEAGAAGKGEGAFRSPPQAPSGAPREGESPGKSQGRSGGKQGQNHEKPAEIPEEKRTKPNRKENEFMLNLMILRNSLRQNAPACRERARAAGKWTWRDIRLMLCLVDRIQNALRGTMPASRDEYYAAYARHGHYELHIDGPVRTSRHLLVTDRHLAAMAEAAMKSECILCMREGAEISRCPLREALLEAAAPSSYQGEGRMVRKCEYREAAGQLIQGHDVTV